MPAALAARFDRSAKPVNTLLANIGSCLLLCERIEVILGTILVLERRQKLVDDRTFIEESAKIRTKVLESLKGELKNQGVTYVDYDRLDRVIERRNWLVHRLPFDRRFQAAADGSGDVFLDEVLFFQSFSDDTFSAYRKRADEIGMPRTWSKASDAVLAAFGDAIQRRAIELKQKKK